MPPKKLVLSDSELAAPGPLFLPSEAKLIQAIAVLMGSMVELARARDSLARQAAELRRRRAALQRKNVALRELLSRDRSLELLEERVRAIASPPAELSGLAGRLSPREVEAADLVRSGLGSKEIGAMLGISEATVERHRHNVRRRLGITGSVNLASYLSGH